LARVTRHRRRRACHRTFVRRIHVGAAHDWWWAAVYSNHLPPRCLALSAVRAAQVKGDGRALCQVLCGLEPRHSSRARAASRTDFNETVVRHARKSGWTRREIPTVGGLWVKEPTTLSDLVVRHVVQGIRPFRNGRHAWSSRSTGCLGHRCLCRNLLVG
jgi:hypothetical protein